MGKILSLSLLAIALTMNLSYGTEKETSTVNIACNHFCVYEFKWDANKKTKNKIEKGKVTFIEIINLKSRFLKDMGISVLNKEHVDIVTSYDQNKQGKNLEFHEKILNYANLGPAKYISKNGQEKEFLITCVQYNHLLFSDYLLIHKQLWG